MGERPNSNKKKVLCRPELLIDNRRRFLKAEVFQIIEFDKKQKKFEFWWGSHNRNNTIQVVPVYQNSNNGRNKRGIDFHDLIVKALLRYEKELCTNFIIQNYAFPLFENEQKDSLGKYINFVRIVDKYQITPLIIKETKNYKRSDFVLKPYIPTNSDPCNKVQIQDIKLEYFTHNNPKTNSDYKTFLENYRKNDCNMKVDRNNLKDYKCEENFHKCGDYLQCEYCKNILDYRTPIINGFKKMISGMFLQLLGEGLSEKIPNKIRPAFLFEHEITPFVCINNWEKEHEIYIFNDRLNFYILPKSTLAGSIDLDFEYPDREPFKFSISYAERDGDRSFRGYNRIIMDNLKKIGEAIVTESLKNILIKAKPGSGKESYSKLLHAGKSHKYRGPIKPVSTAGTLDDVILRIFGEYKSGVNVPGIISKAKGGAVFFDEIDKSEVKLRGKLLRVMETEDYYPNGASTPEQRGTTLFIFAGANFENFEPPDFLTRLYQIEIDNPILNNKNVCFIKKTQKVNKDYLRNLIIYFWFSYFIKLASQHDDNEMKNWIIREYIPRIFEDSSIFDGIFNELIEMNTNNLNFRSIKRTVELKAGRCYYGLDENCVR